MERIQALINRLQEQLDQQSDPSKMMATLQMLQSELQQSDTERNKTLGTSKVAVIMPSVHLYSTADENNKEKNETKVQQGFQKQKIKQDNQLDLHFDPMTEIPTLSHQNSAKDINESSPEQSASLNDKLNEKRTELLETLKEEPIRDLRKAIGINDRYVFIHELFRGDESMFDRCIKTINGFNIYAEAEYWMNRELIVKLGWDEKDVNVKNFYLLVKRRYS